MRVHHSLQNPSTSYPAAARRGDAGFVRHGSTFTLFVLLMSSATVSAQSSGALPTDLGDLGRGRFARATLISDSGAIVGFAQTGTSQAAAAATTPTLSPFFKPRGGALRSIALSSSSQRFEPVAINAQGTVVGTVRTSAGVSGSKKWSTARGHEDIPVPPEYARVTAYDIDDEGNILLAAQQDDYSTPFLLSASGTFTELGCPEDRECVPLAMNEAGTVVGYSTDGERQDAVVWEQLTQQPRRLATPPAVWSPMAVDINAQGVIIGTASMQDSVEPTTALLVWTSRAQMATMVPNSIGRSLNDRGVIAGASWEIGGAAATGFACTWDARAPETSKVVLRGLVAEPSSEANDINKDGLVVGAAADGTGVLRAVTFAR